MTGGTHTQKSLGLWLVEPGSSPHTFDDSSERHEFLTETLAKRRQIVGGRYIRGTRTSQLLRARRRRDLCHGVVRCYASPWMLDQWLPRFLGAEDSDVFGPDETLPSFGMLLDRGSVTFGTASDSIWEFQNCKVAKAVIRARSPRRRTREYRPNPVVIDLHIVALDAEPGTAWPDPAPSLAISATTAPYVFQQSASGVYLNGALRDIMEFAIVLDNHLEPKYSHSLSPYALLLRERSANLLVRAPWNDEHDDLHDQAEAGATGYITLTNGSYSTKFEFGSLQLNSADPVYRGGHKTQQILHMAGRETSSRAYDLQVTNVAA